MTTKQSRKPTSHIAHIDSLKDRRLLSGGLDPTFGTGGYVVGPPSGVMETASVPITGDGIAGINFGSREIS